MAKKLVVCLIYVLLVHIQKCYSDDESLNVPIPVRQLDEGQAQIFMEMEGTQDDETDAPKEYCATLDVLPNDIDANEGDDRLWKGTFDVYLDPDWSSSEENEIYREKFYVVMGRLQEIFGGCLEMRIYPKGATEPTGDYVHVYKLDECASEQIGRKGGKQWISFSDDCNNLGILTHLLMHALGLIHEHNRSDREKHIDVHWENIDSTRYNNFLEVNQNDFSTFDVPYDIKSLMHFNSWIYSKNGHMTLTAKDGSNVGGSRTGIMRESDRLKLRKMYNCCD